MAKRAVVPFISEEAFKQIFIPRGPKYATVQEPDRTVESLQLALKAMKNGYEQITRQTGLDYSAVTVAEITVVVSALSQKISEFMFAVTDGTVLSSGVLLTSNPGDPEVIEMSAVDIPSGADVPGRRAWINKYIRVNFSYANGPLFLNNEAPYQQVYWAVDEDSPSNSVAGQLAITVFTMDGVVAGTEVNYSVIYTAVS